MPSQLRNRLGVNDRRKIDEYLTAVREVEERIGQTESAAKSLPATGVSRPQGVPDDIGEHIRLIFDLIALAFQCDVTRICTFMYANEASNRSYPSINVPDGHHDLSHHGGDPKKHAKLKILNRFHVEQFAYLLGKLKSIQEGSGIGARSLDDRLRQRDQRRRPPQPRQSADPPLRQRGRHDQARPPSQSHAAAAQ